MHEIGVREVVHFAGLTFNWETLCMTWLTMAIVILISWLATRNLKMIPTGSVFVIINAIEEIAKPITLSFRLFGNILAGEILIIILLKLVPIWMPIPSVIWLAFSIFVGGVQAFIFTMLSMAYLANAVKEDEEES